MEEVAARIDAQLAAWPSSDGEARLERDGAALSGRRTRGCELAEARPCGRTHIRDLVELSAITVALASEDASGARERTMEATARSPV